MQSFKIWAAKASHYRPVSDLRRRFSICRRDPIFSSRFFSLVLHGTSLLLDRGLPICDPISRVHGTLLLGLEQAKHTSLDSSLDHFRGDLSPLGSSDH